jgi:hypothetical protein
VAALLLDIIQGKVTIAEASRQFDLPPAEVVTSFLIEQARYDTKEVLIEVAAI